MSKRRGEDAGINMQVNRLHYDSDILSSNNVSSFSNQMSSGNISDRVIRRVKRKNTLGNSTSNGASKSSPPKNPFANTNFKSNKSSAIKDSLLSEKDKKLIALNKGFLNALKEKEEQNLTQETYSGSFEVEVKNYIKMYYEIMNNQNQIISEVPKTLANEKPKEIKLADPSESKENEEEKVNLIKLNDDESLTMEVRAKVMYLKQGEWKTKALGNLMLLKNNKGSGFLRMQNEQTGRVTFNSPLMKGTKVTLKKNCLFFPGYSYIVGESGSLEKEKLGENDLAAFMVKVKTEEKAKKLQEEFQNVV
eukprot:snap_masked-scaffold_2-processed-gene-1.45-mRNA-1 protein AED:1.00 eAED:1.00 QI:0/-1/0/0/-1/1/1/0/305